MAAVGLAYLCGTFPTAQLVGATRGVDPTASGSGNPGATNVYRTLGRRAGALVLAGDALKGAVPVVVGRSLGGRGLATACWLAATVGHVAPVTRRFAGGKGVATAAGGAAVLHPEVTVALGGVFAAVAKGSGKASLASLAIAVGLPVGVALRRRPAHEVAEAAVVSALVIARHGDNVRRLLRGEELGFAGPVASSTEVVP